MGIELLKKGNNAKEHAKRFTETGIYWPIGQGIQTYALDDGFETITVHTKEKESIVVKIK